MEQRHRDVITKNYVFLTQNLIPNADLLASLRQSLVLTPSMAQDIEDLHTTSKKRSTLLTYIPTRGPKAFGNFMKALEDSGQEYIAEKLDPKPVEQKPVDPKPVVSAGGGDEKEQDQGGKLKIEITNVPLDSVDGLKRNAIPGFYPMERKPRGRCVIINNKNFYTMNDREGSDLDEENLVELFKKLDFDVEVWKDVTKEKAKENILKESKNPAHQTADAFIFIAMSHGTKGKIFTKDGEKLDIEKDIVEYFGGDSSCCPALSGKPKIFLIQACQGRTKSAGVPQADSDDPKIDNITKAVRQLSIQGDSEKQDTTGNLVHEMGDILIAYATVPDFEALRVPTLGSWFIREFVISCGELAHENHLLDILTVVAARVRAKQIEFPGFQQATRTDVRLSKHFYFFPGYFGKS